MSYPYDFDECHCSCHNSDMEVYHCMPCCHQCPHCGKNIVTHAYDQHVEECRNERIAMGLPLDQYNILNDLTQLEALMKQKQEEQKEESPAVKLLREFQERERKLGK